MRGQEKEKVGKRSPPIGGSLPKRSAKTLPKRFRSRHRFGAKGKGKSGQPQAIGRRVRGNFSMEEFNLISGGRNETVIHKSQVA